MSLSGPVVFVIALLAGAALGAALVADRAQTAAELDPAGTDGGSSSSDAPSEAAIGAPEGKSSAPRVFTIKKDDNVGPATGACFAGIQCQDVVGQSTRRVSLGLNGASWSAHDLNLTWTASSPLTARFSAALRACPPKDPCTSSKTLLASIEGSSPLRFRDDAVSIARTSVLWLEVTVATAQQPATSAHASPTPQSFHIEGTVKAPQRAT